MNALEKESEKIVQTHLDEAVIIQQRTGTLRKIWEQLTKILKERDAKLEGTGDLHRFLKNLDQFQHWVSKSKSDITNKDSLASLAEDEKLIIRTSTNQGRN